MRFLIDENLPFSLVRLLQAIGHEVVYAGHGVLRGAVDEQLESAALDESTVPVTKDVDFAELRVSRGLPAVLIRVPDWFGRKQIRETFENYLKHPLLPEAEQAFTVVEFNRVTGNRLPGR